MLYGRLDDQREQAAGRLSQALHESGGTHQARLERDAAIARYTDQVAQFDAVENGLCFGRLDFSDGSPRYVGRIGIFDSDGDFEPLLMDWRAPAARPFYVATAASPDGVTRRRHIRTRQRKVVGLDDEVLDLGAATATANGRAGLTGEAALLAAIDAGRTGRMKDIVETIQVEQDRVIRADLGGVLVVHGGPGTGKTAVALHRAAYLLYTYRRQLSQQGVLIVGPNATFLRYISQVLPSLAETGVLLRTIGELYPGLRAAGPEPADVAEVKGRLVMAEVLAAAVGDRQRVPDGPLEIRTDRETLRLDPHDCAAARLRARRSGRPHNLARAIFVDHLVDVLAEQVAERIGEDPWADDPLGGDDAPGAGTLLVDEAEIAEIRRDLAADPAVLAALDELWPVLTPQRLLADLLGSDERLASAAPGLTGAERALLRRDPADAWTPADVPPLDEAAELLGEDRSAYLARAELIRRARIAQAQGVLDIIEGSAEHERDDDDPEVLLAVDLLDAERLAERQDHGERLTAAQRAAGDRTWMFGHVIVDEAQEVSAMAWRLLMRRCPSRSMTVVGDVAQTGALAGTSSWREVLEPYVADRWRLAELTVSYRTPAEIMAVAAEVLAAIDPSLEPPRSVRRTGVDPWRREVPERDLRGTLVDGVLGEAGAVPDGQVGVIVPAGRLDELGRAVSDAVPEAAIGEDLELESRVVVLTVRQAKGLEFDAVIVVDPDRIVAESPRGHSDLYVALTRATRRLGVIAPAGSAPAPAGAPGRGRRRG